MNETFRVLVEGLFGTKLSFSKIKLKTKNTAKHTLNFDFDLKPQPKETETKFKQYAPNISEQNHKKAIHTYTKESKDMNGHLWSGSESNPEQKAVISHLSNAIKSAKPAHEDFHVYSGMSLNPHEHENGKIHIPAFTSTSSDHRVAGNFAKKTTIEHIADEHGVLHPTEIHHVLKINVKKGQHVGAFIGGHSTRQFEHEFLIHKNHTFHLSGKHEDHVQSGGIFSKPKIYRVHEATVETHE